MLRGLIQRELENQLLKNGIIENLGKTYRANSESPRRINTNMMKNFINKISNIYDIEVIIGKRGGYETAKIVLNSR